MAGAILYGNTVKVISMPAIRFLYNGIFALATMPPDNNHWVEVRMHNGKPKRFEFLGLICKAGINSMPDGGYVKIIAVEVTNGDGQTYGEWRKVGHKEVVLGFRVLHKLRGQASWGIYGVVGNDGWPIVIEDKSYKDPEIKKAKLYHFRAQEIPKKKQSHSEKDRA